MREFVRTSPKSSPAARTASLALGLLLLIATVPAGAQGDPPNLLLILVDDVGIEHLNFYGLQDPPGIYALTPNLDDWDDVWLRFSDAWSNPFCSPTRVTLQSGKYGYRTGVGDLVPDDAVWGLESFDPDLLPKLLTDPLLAIPYQTAAFGKWHMGTSDGPPPADEVPDQGGPNAPGEAGYQHFEGILVDQQLDPGLVYAHYWKTTNGGSPVEIGDPPNTPLIYLTNDTVEWFIDWYDNVRVADQPWFTYVAFTAAHEPFHCPPTELYGEICGSGSDLDHYQAMIKTLDVEIEKLLNHIGGNGGADPPTNPPNTLIILASDNGSPAAVALDPVDGNKAKCTVFQGGVRVPLMIGGDDVTADVALEGQYVGLIDLFRTIAEVARVDPLDLNGLGLDSLSLEPYFTEANPLDPLHEDPIYTEWFYPNFDPGSTYGPSAWQQAARNETHKLVRISTGGVALFDLAADPFEDSPLPLPPTEQVDKDALLELALFLNDIGDLRDLCTGYAKVGTDCTVDADCCSKMCVENSPGDRKCVNPLFCQ